MTLVLETDLGTAEGSIRLVDFMPPGVNAVHVVRLVEARVAEVTTFGSGMFPRFGLPATLDDPGEPGEAHAAG